MIKSKKHQSGVRTCLKRCRGGERTIKNSTETFNTQRENTEGGMHAPTVEKRGDPRLGWKATGAVAAEDAQPAAASERRALYISPKRAAAHSPNTCMNPAAARLLLIQFTTKLQRRLLLSWHSQTWVNVRRLSVGFVQMSPILYAHLFFYLFECGAGKLGTIWILRLFYSGSSYYLCCLRS